MPSAMHYPQLSALGTSLCGTSLDAALRHLGLELAVGLEFRVKIEHTRLKPTVLAPNSHTTLAGSSWCGPSHKLVTEDFWSSGFGPGL